MKIVTISDSPTLFSGLARVHRHAIDAMVAAGHEVKPFGWFAYDTQTIESIGKGATPPPKTYNGIPVTFVPKKDARKTADTMATAFAGYPDVIVTIGDHWDFHYMKDIKVNSGYLVRWVACLTVERDDIEEKWLELLKYADDIVVPSEFGRDVLRRFGFEAKIVPYGAEGVFQRAPEARRAQLRRERNCEDKVRFITVAQNTGRKNLPALIQAVEQMAHRDPQRIMQFYLHTNFGHCDPQDPFLYDLKKIIKKLGVQEWFVFPHCDNEASMYKAPADEVLVDEYNAADFFVLPSNFEGYGLPVVEAMACGLPAIVNGTSTMPEHLGAAEDQTFGLAKRGFMVSSRMEIRPPDTFVRTVRPDALAHAIWEMRLFAGDKKRTHELEGMRLACEEYGRSKTWDRMKEGLVKVIATDAPAVVPSEVL